MQTNQQMCPHRNYLIRKQGSQNLYNLPKKIAKPFLLYSFYLKKVNKFVFSHLLIAITFIILGKFEINPEAAEFLQSLSHVKLGVVAVCGKYRTGKSYLLNKLFIEDYF